jgi:hypothetical protein
MMEEIWIAEGALLRNGNSPELCRTQVEIKLERGGNVSDLLTAPLGNHLILLPGHHMKRLLASRETMLGLGK